MNQPNIVIVLCDTLRRDVLDVYGGSVSTEPLAEALGGNLVSYLGYSNSFWTIPSHFSLFTGLPVGKHGVHEAPGMNTIEVVMELGRRYKGSMLAWELRRRGYETIGISANPLVSHLSGLDNGFKHFVPHDPTYRPLPGLDLNEWLELRETGKIYNQDKVRAFVGEAHRKGLLHALRLVDAYIRMSTVRLLTLDYITDKGAAVAISILRSFQLTEPFFIFVNLMEAHEPYYINDPNPILLALKSAGKGNHKVGSTIKRLRKGYLRSAKVCVRAVAEIAKALREKKVLQRTIFVFTSDHGQELMEHGALGHDSGHLYEEDVGIPIIVKPPEGLELSASNCYVGLHELYGLAVVAASGERRWSPSCGPGLAESYDGVDSDPEAGRGARRVAVFKGDRKAAYRLEGDAPVIEEVAVAGRPLDLRSAEVRRIAGELGQHAFAR